MNDIEKTISTRRLSEIPAKRRGRPSRNGAKKPWHFGRALTVIDAYTTARERGEKHSVAVRETVAFVRRRHPEMPISETEVKRILADLRPQNSSAVLTVTCSILEGEEAARRRSFFEQIPQGIQDTVGSTDQNRRRPLTRFILGFRKRPNYVRHNAKGPNS